MTDSPSARVAGRRGCILPGRGLPTTWIIPSAASHHPFLPLGRLLHRLRFASRRAAAQRRAGVFSPQKQRTRRAARTCWAFPVSKLNICCPCVYRINGGGSRAGDSSCVVGNPAKQSSYHPDRRLLSPVSFRLDPRVRPQALPAATAWFLPVSRTEVVSGLHRASSAGRPGSAGIRLGCQAP
jgi:hypothetical protein